MLIESHLLKLHLCPTCTNEYAFGANMPCLFFLPLQPQLKSAPET